MEKSMFQMVPPEKLVHPGFQLRKVKKDSSDEKEKNEFNDLAASISAQGILQPLVCKRLENGDLEIISGTQRQAIAIEQKIALVPVFIRDGDLLSQVAANNSIRQRPTEIAAIVKQALLEGYSVDKIAKSLGRSVVQVAKYVSADTLPAEVQKRFIDGNLSIETISLVKSKRIPEEKKNEFLLNVAPDAILSHVKADLDEFTENVRKGISKVNKPVDKPAIPVYELSPDRWKKAVTIAFTLESKGPSIRTERENIYLEVFYFLSSVKGKMPLGLLTAEEAAKKA